MSEKWEDVTDEFDAVSEDGRQFHILVYTTMIDASSRSNPSAAPLKGLKSARTADGLNCNHIDDKTFEIVQLGLRVTRV